MENMFQRSFLP